MSSVGSMTQKQIKAAIGIASSPATFAVGGDVARLPQPSIEVAGVGRLLLPLRRSQRSSLLEISSPLPCCQIMEGEVYLTIGNALQINSTSIKLGASFQHAVDNLVFDEFLPALGLQSLKNYVKAKLAKLVLYPKGAVFGPHFAVDDQSIQDAVFAILVVQLPSMFSSGIQIVTDHAGRTKEFDSSRNSDKVLYASTFFTDCRQKVREVVRGCKACLV